MAGAKPTPKSAQSSSKNTAFTMQKRLQSMKVHEYTLVTGEEISKYGYRNREDITILPPGVLVLGSYNVITDVGERLDVVKGYTLDGQANSTLNKISSSYDFTKLQTNDTHVRTWDINLNFRYVHPTTNTVEWVTLFTGISPGVDVNYTQYQDIVQSTSVVLFVQGGRAIYRWSAAVTPFSSATSTTITKEGITTFSEVGFDEVGLGSISFSPTSTTANTATFEIGDSIMGSSSGATATVTQVNGNILVLDSISGGPFTSADSITGSTSGATGTVNIYTPPSASFNVIIDGIEYNYTGGVGTTTLTGVTPDPTLGGHVAGTSIAQAVQTIDLDDVTGNIPVTYTPNIIGNLDNQIFLGSFSSPTIFTSNTNDFMDYSYSTPRLPAEGAVSIVAGFPQAFVNQEDNLYISVGQDLWYETQFNQNTITTYPGGTTNPSVTTVYENLVLQQLKTTFLQAAQSQAATTKIKNDIVYLSFEPIINSLGRVTNILISPQISDMSYPIVNDMNRYDWTDASMIYFRQFLYVSVPKEGLIRVYNMTQPKIQYWESPVTYPIGRFSIIDDQLYGHGYNVPETYQLFNGTNFNGAAIPAAAYFSYNQYGTRNYPKDFTGFYLEGYISPNCTLTYGLNYDINGCQTQVTYTLDGTQVPQVCIGGLPDASLGKASLGSRPLSGLTMPGSIATSTDTGLPPKFRAIKQTSKKPFYELQVFFQSLGTDQQWSLLAFGPNAAPATEGSVSIQY